MALVARAGETRDWKGIHVIEYSAMDQMAECFSAEQDRRLKAEKERDEARAEIERLKTYWKTHSESERGESWAQIHRDKKTLVKESGK